MVVALYPAFFLKFRLMSTAREVHIVPKVSDQVSLWKLETDLVAFSNSSCTSSGIFGVIVVLEQIVNINIYTCMYSLHTKQ